MNRVFVTNYAGHDFTAALVYGELYFLTRGYVSFQSLDRVNYQVAEAIEKAGVTSDDYLLLSGVSILCVMSALIWYYKFGMVKLLIFDPPTEVYRELTLTRTNFDTLLNEVEVALSQDGKQKD